MQIAKNMFSSRRLQLLCAATGMVVAGLAYGATSDQTRSFDPLQRASVMSVRATAALMTSVVRAGSRLVAVGERGTVLSSDDNGVSWTQRPSPVSVMLTNVRFASPQRGWAVGHGGVVLTTADGGMSWIRQIDGIGVAALTLEAAKALSLKAPGEESQKALAEAERLVTDGPDKPFFALLVDDDKRLTIVGAYGLAIRSVDGGATWMPWSSHIPNSKGSHLYAIERSGSTIYIAGEQGSVFRSNDNAESFTALDIPYSGSFFGVTTTDANHLMVFGLRGHAYASSDGGQTWTERTVGTAASLTAGTVLQDGSLIIVSQAGNVLRSAGVDAGFSALKVNQPVPFVGVVEAPDGSLVMAGVRGMTRFTEKLQGNKP